MNVGMERKRALKVTQVFKPLGTGGRGWWQGAIESGEPKKRVFKAGNRDLHIGHIAFEGWQDVFVGITLEIQNWSSRI